MIDSAAAALNAEEEEAEEEEAVFQSWCSFQYCLEEEGNRRLLLNRKAGSRPRPSGGLRNSCKHERPFRTLIAVHARSSERRRRRVPEKGMAATDDDDATAMISAGILCCNSCKSSGSAAAAARRPKRRRSRRRRRRRPLKRVPTAAARSVGQSVSQSVEK